MTFAESPRNSSQHHRLSIPREALLPKLSSRICQTALRLDPAGQRGSKTRSVPVPPKLDDCRSRSRGFRVLTDARELSRADELLAFWTFVWKEEWRSVAAVRGELGKKERREQMHAHAEVRPRQPSSSRTRCRRAAALAARSERPARSRSRSGFEREESSLQVEPASSSQQRTKQRNQADHPRPHDYLSTKRCHRTPPLFIFDRRSRLYDCIWSCFASSPLWRDRSRSARVL